MSLNADLRLKIVEMIKESGEGHIPSSFSIVDIINFLYGNILRYDPSKPKWKDRDYFVLSKGHGCAALYVVLEKFKFLSREDIERYSKAGGILGGHPDLTVVPGVEASTGSLGHGFPTAVGIALGTRITQSNNRIYALLGDGECHEGTVWESANIAANLKLDNLTAIIDWNGSAAQLMPIDELPKKWAAFGWNCYEIDGHSESSMGNVFAKIQNENNNKPNVVIARTVKGKGVPLVEGHGKWHHKIPNDQEFKEISNILTKVSHEKA